MTSQFCSSCGKPLSSGVSFCPYCGARVAASTVAVPGTPILFTSTPRGGFGLARIPLSRARITAFAVLAGLVIAFAVFTFYVTHDLQILFVGVLIVAVLYAIVILLRPAQGEPAA